MNIKFDDDEIILIKDKSIIKCKYPQIIFKEETAGGYRLGEEIFTCEEKTEILNKVNQQYNYKGCPYNKVTIHTGDQICTLKPSIIKEYLNSEIQEFLFEIDGAKTFSKERAIDEAWDVWTNITNLLLSKGVSYKELYAGHQKNMEKKIKRGYRYLDKANKTVKEEDNKTLNEIDNIMNVIDIVDITKSANKRMQDMMGN